MKVELLKPVTLATLIALAAPAFAQDDTTATDPAADATTTTDTTSETPTDGAAPELDMGTEVTAERQPGQTYVKEVIGDWELQCAHNPEGEDPCQLYQLLKDGAGNPVAEISFLRLPDGGQAMAGATVIAPLETLLQQQLTLSIDNGTARRYSFRFCGQQGCIAQIGFSPDEVAAFKAGNVAKAVIVPARAPDQKVELPISLIGFTKAFDAIPVPVAPAQ